MGTTTFTGPVKSGNVLQSDGTGSLASVGGSSGIANVGFTLMAQSEVISQAGQADDGVYTTSIVIPAQSQIYQIALNVTTVWDGVADTLGFGTTVDDVFLTPAAAVAGTDVGQVLVGPGALTAANWTNVGDTDVQVVVTSTNTGAGVGTLTVLYVQAINLLLP